MSGPTHPLHPRPKRPPPGRARREGHTRAVIFASHRGAYPDTLYRRQPQGLGSDAAAGTLYRLWQRLGVSSMHTDFDMTDLVSKGLDPATLLYTALALSGGQVTPTQVEGLGVSRRTAQRACADLLSQGLLTQHHESRNTFYRATSALHKAYIIGRFVDPVCCPGNTTLALGHTRDLTTAARFAERTRCGAALRRVTGWTDRPLTSHPLRRSNSRMNWARASAPARGNAL